MENTPSDLHAFKKSSPYRVKKRDGRIGCTYINVNSKRQYFGNSISSGGDKMYSTNKNA